MVYDLLLTCERGCAPYVQREAELRQIGKTYEPHETCLVIRGCSDKDCVKAAYLMQTPLRIALLLEEFDISLDLEESIISFEKMIKDVDLKSILPKDKSMIVHTDRIGLHEFNSVDASQELGQIIKQFCEKNFSFSPKVDMKKADILFYLKIHEMKAWFSLDLVGKSPAKRDYKIFNNPHSVKGPVAACLLMMSDWKPKDSLLDPFAADGIIPIEAALFASGTSIHFYDKKLACKNYSFFSKHYDSVIEKIDSEKSTDIAKIFSFDAQLRNVTAAKKNAKIAGVDKFLSFSKMDLEWVDTKCGAKTVKKIITHPLEASKHVSLLAAKKIREELFYAADYILQKNGSLTFLSHKPEDLLLTAEKQGFVETNKAMINTGKQPIWIISFSRKKDLA